MSSDYFDSSDHQQVAATRARASAINNALDAIDTGLALLPTEAQVKRGLINYGVDSGIADAYVVTLPHTAAALTDGMQVVFKASAVNTGACTINVDSLGVKSIKRHDGTNPVAGDIGADKITELRYNSTSATFEIQGNVGVAAGAGTMSAQNANAVAITGGTMSNVSPLPGFFIRPVFAKVDGDTVTVNGGCYDVNGTLAKITGELTTVAHGITGADMAYLYIDYSAIPADGVLIQATLIWSATEPAWSSSKTGWYNGNDRCIFAFYVAVTSDDIFEFVHDGGDYVSMLTLNVQGVTDIDDSFTDSSVFRVPSFAEMVQVKFLIDANADAQSSYWYWRPNGSSDAVGQQIGKSIQDADTETSYYLLPMRVMLGTGDMIELRGSAVGDQDHKIGIDQYGWYLPRGI